MEQNMSYDVIQKQKLVDKYLLNRAVDETVLIVLAIFYSILICFGALGNILVIVSVARRPAMRTPRNMFIVNLAISDLLLCTVTMPLTLMEIVTKYFPLGNNVLICKTIGILEGTSIFVSTVTITAIALDRYQVIVYPTKQNLQMFGALITLVIIWVFAIILASPLFIIRSLHHHKVYYLNMDICFEDWPVEHGRAYYSIFTIVIQYFVPILIVCTAHIRISYKVRYRFTAGFVSNESSNRNREELRGRRLQKINVLLGSIAIIFLVSWLPLNLFNLIADLYNFDVNNTRIYFAVCHMIGMSSACSNPVLYGYFNDNFWKEFNDILCKWRNNNREDVPESQKLSCQKPSLNDSSRSKPDLVVGTTEFTNIV